MLAVGFKLQPKRAEGPQAEGWTAVAEGQTQLLSAAKKRRAEQTCELRNSPTQGRRPQGQPQKINTLGRLLFITSVRLI